MGTETDIQITDCLDWLRFTVARSIGQDDILPPFPSLARTGEIIGRGFYGYDRAMPLEGGGYLMWHSEQREMKYCVELDGGALAELRRDGFEVEQILEHNMAAKLPELTYNRIDYAIDIKNAGIEVFDLWKEIEKNKVKMKARKSRFLRSHESDLNGDTVEVGSRQSSPRFLRVYDKAAQMGMRSVSWARIELEIKKARTNAFARSVALHGRSETGRRELSEVITTKVGWYNAAIAGEKAPHIDVPRPLSAPNKFVLEHIIPFLKNHSGELTEDTKRELLTTVEDYLTLTGY
jgi:hypothetical protein